MKVYILLAKGMLKDLPSSSMLHVAQQAFKSRRKAESFVPEFRRRITTRSDKFDLKCLDADREIVIRIEELEVIK